MTVTGFESSLDWLTLPDDTETYYLPFVRDEWNGKVLIRYLCFEWTHTFSEDSKELTLRTGRLYPSLLPWACFS